MRWCSWEWPTSTPSGTASRLWGLSAVRFRIQESKSICLTFLSEWLCLHLCLPLPLPVLIASPHSKATPHRDGNTATVQSRSCWAGQLSVCTHRVCFHVYICVFLPALCVWLVCTTCVIVCKVRSLLLLRHARLFWGTLLFWWRCVMTQGGLQRCRSELFSFCQPYNPFEIQPE